MQSLLFIAKNWPEPNSTAAGRRTLDVFTLFQNWGFDITVACAADTTPFQHDLSKLSIKTERISLNDSHVDDWFRQLNPTIVVYDRFVTEEQFGWRIQNCCPDAVTILDTSDFHTLRVAREQAFKKQTEVDLFSDTAIREISAISRCDLTLMISAVEMNLLMSTFSIPEPQLFYLPFLVHEQEVQPSLKGYEDREHLIMMGGFKHEPNKDATRWLKQSLWPEIRKRLPNHVEMHVYGAYVDHGINQLHNPKERFYIKGRADDALKTFSNYRVNLAPLRFGAGQKGKILEGWLTGTPTVTTPIGLEAMAEPSDLSFAPTEDPILFAEQVAALYLQSDTWQNEQQLAYRHLTHQFNFEHFNSSLKNRVFDILNNLESHRHKLFWRRLLWQNTTRATEYMSRWIEAKTQLSNVTHSDK